MAIKISLPDRYDMLARKATGQLAQIVSPVEGALSYVDSRYAEMRASSRGSFVILRGSSGTGKSTFANTIGLFRADVSTISISRDKDIADDLRRLPSTGDHLRVVVLEGREALTDVSKELLEKAVHAINGFVRTEQGQNSLVIWLVNSEDLSERLSQLAMEIGAESLIGLGDPIYRFQGPDQSEFVSIANKTLALLNQGETLHDLGISDERAQELVAESTTIGAFLARIRNDLLTNQQRLHQLAKKEQCRVWIVVLAGNEPEADIDALTRGTLYSADIDRMLSVTNANIVQELKKVPEKLGLLATFLDARLLYVPVLAALAVIRTHADDTLRSKMRTSGMSVALEKDSRTRLAETNLAASFNDRPIGSRKVGGKVGSNSVEAFKKLAAIAENSDSLLNRAIAEGLKDLGVLDSYDVEQDFGNGLTRRTDIVAVRNGAIIRIEMMWRGTTGRAQIANYALTKLFNYGKAVGYLS